MDFFLITSEKKKVYLLRFSNMLYKRNIKYFYYNCIFNNNIMIYVIYKFFPYYILFYIIKKDIQTSLHLNAIYF